MASQEAFPASMTLSHPAWAAANLSMIDTKNSPLAEGDKSEGGLEEARLRQQAIGVKLRHMFDQVVNEPVPDEFLDILRRADERSSSKGGA